MFSCSLAHLAQASIARSWAEAVLVAQVLPGELPGVRGSEIIPRCTRPAHGRGCGCARGAVRLYRTNHDRASMSRSFNAIRRALGAVPWEDDASVDVVR